MENVAQPMSITHTPTIHRYKSPLRWPGGKTRALPALRKLMPDLSQVADYREPLVGGGSVFLYIRNELALGGYVWINDLFKPLHRFWMGCQHPDTILEDLFNGYDEFKSYPQEQWSRLFDEVKARGDKLTAEELFFINRCAFSGNITGGFSKSAAETRYTESALRRVFDITDALTGAVITCQDYEEVVKASGSPKDVFMFLDPPYIGVKGLYNVGGAGEFDHYRLEFLLRKTRYKFMLTLNDTTEVRQLYNWANIQPLSIQYGMDNVAGNSPKKAQELIIRNYV